VTAVVDPSQYSDQVTYTATLSPAQVNSLAPATSVTFDVNGVVMGTDSTATSTSGHLEWSITAPLLETSLNGSNPTNGPLKPGSKTVTATFGGVDPNFKVYNATTNLTVTKENASAVYTGPMLAFTPTATAMSVTVTLTATVTDDADGARGDIRNAAVTFYSNGAPLTAPCANLQPALVNAADKTVGTVACQWSFPIGSGSDPSATYDIGIAVNNYYDRSPGFDGELTVTQPSGNFITGGGYQIMQNSAGAYAATSGSRANFGFNVKYNKSNTNLQGHVNVIFRSGSKVYQIKSNSLTTLGTSIPDPSKPPSSTNAAKANFQAKANLNDVTNPNAPVSLGGNLTLQILMTDNGEPGNADTIVVSLYQGSTLLYSGNFVGGANVEKLLDGGNLVVH